MIRMSALRNRPVVLSNRQIGYLQTAILDHAQKRVQALIVSRGIQGKCIVLPEQVCHMTDCCILIDGMKKYERMSEKRPCRFAVDTTGRLVGRITDYAVSPKRLEIIAVEIMPGYMPPELSVRIWIYEYQRAANAAHTLTIPALNSYEPTYSWEGS